MLLEQLTGHGQDDAEMDMVEQPDIQLDFQAFDLLAHRGLGGTQLHGGEGKA